MNWEIQNIYEEIIREKDKLIEVLTSIDNTINMLEHIDSIENKPEILELANKINNLIRRFNTKIDCYIEKMLDILEKLRLENND